ncbi:MAG: aconitate hydratase, partial [Euryarchaeota archaeon]|nr:aconitate hydratase [Euryarchaeota archaeon]
LLPLRSNIPALAEHVFERVDPGFAARAKEWGGGAVVGGENYGQGSSREHAALCPMALGVGLVLAKSFARIHRANLVNFGILPLALQEPGDYDDLPQGAEVEVPDTRRVRTEAVLTLRNTAKNREFRARHGLSPREVDVLLAGGLLNYIRSGTPA